MVRRFSADEKLSLINRFLAGERISSICREVAISRTIFYKWIQIYKQFPHSKAKNHLKVHFVKSTKHYRSFSLRKKYAVLRFCLENPHFSTRQIASKFDVSHHFVWRLLSKSRLNSRENRLQYISIHGSNVFSRLDSQTKIVLLERFESGDSVASICREFRISRTIFYRWLKRYLLASDSRDHTIFNILGSGETHYRYDTQVRKLIFDIINTNSNFSVRKVQKELIRVSGANIASRHLISSVLRSYSSHSI